MKLLPFSPPRLWPDWQPPDSVLRAHACTRIAGATGGDVRDWIGRGMRVWQPGFLPRHVCVRFLARPDARGRVHALVPKPGCAGGVHLAPTWGGLRANRRELSPRIVRASAVAWIAFAFSLPAGDEVRLVMDPADLVLPADLGEARRSAIQARVVAPEVVSEGADGLLVRAVVSLPDGLRDTLFHIRRDGEIHAGAGRYIDLGPSDELSDFFGRKTGVAA